ncbi:MAG: ATP-binding cassette domain-containing protein [Holosporaceae bacterium]|jgi:polar amino acid transport system ATP-binding protein|nr:ATP-binding cassette domain-containing protein [Holosporaceae bacterium]
MLKIRDICKSFNGVKILDRVNLQVETGGILGLAGPSGCGKSTLLRCIQKLEIPESGSIEYDGKAGFMFQDFQLFPHMTVMQNLLYVPNLKSKQRKKQEHQAIAVLKNIGIESKKHDYPVTLSGGQKQRVALARTLMTSPDILLCDEPTSGLDVATTDDVVQLLKSVNRVDLNSFGNFQKQTVTMVIASHDLDFLTKISDRIVLLKNGKIVADIKPSNFDDQIQLLKGYYL